MHEGKMHMCLGPVITDRVKMTTCTLKMGQA